MREREDERKAMKDILAQMMAGREGDSNARERVFAMARLAEHKQQVEACRLALCHLLRLDERTGLSELLRVPLQTEPVPASERKDLEGVYRPYRVRCSQCTDLPIPGDDRCYLHKVKTEACRRPSATAGMVSASTTVKVRRGFKVRRFR